MADVESTKGRADIVPDVSEEPPFLKQGQVQLADVDDDEEFTVPEQRKIIHKVDHRLLVLLGLIQAVSFIDRANMSNAAVAGMTPDLSLGKSNRYSITLLAFFPTFIAFQFPASVLVRKIGPRYFLASIVCAWGIVVLGFGFVKNWWSLIPLRATLGAFEAGAIPSQYFLISSWYARYDLHTRTSVFFLVGVLGSAMTGLLGLAFSRMEGVGGVRGWSWIFIMEGIITILIGITTAVFMVDFPDKAHLSFSFLTKKEGDFIVRRINRDRQDAEPEAFSMGRFLRPALDLKIWGFALLYYCTTIQNYAVGFFLPVILHQKLGFSGAASQGLSTPPYLAAMILMFVEGVISDRIRLRFPTLVFNSLLTIMGLCLLVWAPSAGAQYAGAIFATAGPSANLPAIMVFQANNIRGTWKRAFSSASLIGMGGVGGITGSLVFRSQDAPEYLPGIYCCMTANGVILLTTLILVMFFIRQNKAADRSEIVIENLPGFRFAK